MTRHCEVANKSLSESDGVSYGFCRGTTPGRVRSGIFNPLPEPRKGKTFVRAKREAF
jgi:hypothetical protein